MLYGGGNEGPRRDGTLAAAHWRPEKVKLSITSGWLAARIIHYPVRYRAPIGVREPAFRCRHHLCHHRRRGRAAGRPDDGPINPRPSTRLCGTATGPAPQTAARPPTGSNPTTSCPAARAAPMSPRISHCSVGSTSTLSFISATTRSSRSHRLAEDGSGHLDQPHVNPRTSNPHGSTAAAASHAAATAWFEHAIVAPMRARA